MTIPIPPGLKQLMALAGNMPFAAQLKDFAENGIHLGGSGSGPGTKAPQLVWAATGGIATKHVMSHVGEGGYPEAIIPLNERGATYMANVFQQYLGNTDAKGAMVNPYSTYITNNNNYTYDHSTRYTGPITVQASDPDEMNAKLQAKQRRARLANPVGAR
jgi:hypothetical protein